MEELKAGLDDPDFCNIVPKEKGWKKQSTVIFLDYIQYLKEAKHKTTFILIQTHLLNNHQAADHMNIKDLRSLVCVVH